MRFGRADGATAQRGSARYGLLAGSGGGSAGTRGTGARYKLAGGGTGCPGPRSCHWSTDTLATMRSGPVETGNGTDTSSCVIGAGPGCDASPTRIPAKPVCQKMRHVTSPTRTMSKKSEKDRRPPARARMPHGKPRDQHKTVRHQRATEESPAHHQETNKQRQAQPQHTGRTEEKARDQQAGTEQEKYSS